RPISTRTAVLSHCIRLGEEPPMSLPRTLPVVSLLVLLALEPAAAQVAPALCACNEDRDFGACVVNPAPGSVNVPSRNPGCAVVVSTTTPQNQPITYLYVADLYE